MTALDMKVAELNALIKSGNTIRAIELFYSEEATMQENEDVPRVGKQNCIKHEEQNLKNVKEVTCKLLSQAINNADNVVFSEWEVVFSNKNNKSIKLTEVSVQHWSKGQIVKEKFYYKNFHPTT